MAIGVLLAHVKMAWFPGAHIFMDIFFVISAFLITTTLKKGIEKRHEIQLKTFWSRRLLRLYPALVTVVVTYTIIAFFVQDAMAPILKDGLLTLLYVSNFTKLENYDWPHFFGHTWSLSIEEQFYLVWPVLLVLLLRFDALWRLRVPLLTTAIVASICWRLYLVGSDAQWERLYYGSDTRIDAFIVGGLLAFFRDDLLALADKSKLFLGFLHIATVSLFLAVALWDPKILYYFIWQQPTVLILTCLTIVLLTRDADSVVRRLFSNPILAWMGVRCYGIYLWHWPMIWLLLVNTKIREFELLAIVFPATMLLSWAMYKYIEEPILKRRPAMKTREPSVAQDPAALT